MSISIDPINFEAATKKYISDIISLFNPENKSIVVLNQLYPVGKYGHYASYFEDEVKTITVQRDPRDIYIAAKKINTTYSSWIPTSNVNDFITYFKLINMLKKKNTENLQIKFLFHTCSMIERLILGESLNYNGIDSLISIKPELYRIIKNCFKDIEEIFFIEIPDTEIGYIMDLLDTQ